MLGLQLGQHLDVDDARSGQVLTAVCNGELYRLDRLTYSVQVTHYVAQLYACIYPVAFQLVCGYKLEIQLCYRCCIVHDQTGKF